MLGAAKGIRPLKGHRARTRRRPSLRIANKTKKYSENAGRAGLPFSSPLEYRPFNKSPSGSAATSLVPSLSSLASSLAFPLSPTLLSTLSPSCLSPLPYPPLYSPVSSLPSLFSPIPSHFTLILAFLSGVTERLFLLSVIKLRFCSTES